MKILILSLFLLIPSLDLYQSKSNKLAQSVNYTHSLGIPQYYGRGLYGTEKCYYVRCGDGEVYQIYSY
jgi:hypothetical protein